ncbi:hypothetical protein [Pantoea vagans]|uniref:hypothetical protein n=1 Tax=Pantoea vagans TaxID=470934 RepID=UPI0023B1D3C0|nr:hypothetical protein [Pantoea vagans]MDE8556081.1 hypothetical protein [Pantoea vagans]MDE8576132.1 hypothetical protein [Pantoea vagans]
MFIHTDLLRAALCCVADQKEERRYLQGVNITSTHIQATDGRAFISMEHGCNDTTEGVFIFEGPIPDEADGTVIKHLGGNDWLAVHMQESGKVVWQTVIEQVDAHYPDFSRLLSGEPEQCTSFPIFQARLLALPYRMFDMGIVPVKFKPWGDGRPCQLILDETVNRLYGNPVLIIMPMTNDTFEKLEQAFDEV